MPAVIGNTPHDNLKKVNRSTLGDTSKDQEKELIAKETEDEVSTINKPPGKKFTVEVVEGETETIILGDDWNSEDEFYLLFSLLDLEIDEILIDFYVWSESKDHTKKDLEEIVNRYSGE